LRALLRAFPASRNRLWPQPGLYASGAPERRLPSPAVLSSSAWRVAAAVLAVHLAWITAFFAAGHEIRDFIRIGTDFVAQSDASDVIELDPDYNYPENYDADIEGQGYDGQFSYYIALDPGEGRHYTDDPPYRYARILYPVAARVIGLGQPEAIPWVLLALNLAAVVGGTLALAAWLRRRGSSPWFAVLYGLFPGLLVGLQRDLTEPLAYGLVAIAVYLFDLGGRRGVLAAGAVFGLAGLTRQTTLVFPLLFALSLFAGKDRRPSLAAGFTALALVPAIVWGAVLIEWLGSLGEGGGRITAVPFGGLLSGPWELARQPVALVFVFVPAIVWAAVGFAAVGSREGRLAWACLWANVAVAHVFTGRFVWESYIAVSRISTGVVLAAILCIPYLRSIAPRSRQALIGASALWVAPFPAIVVYGFADIQL
jgi:hypothetical protein